VTVTDKEIIKKKIRDLHNLTNEEYPPLQTVTQIASAVHDVADVIDYLYDKLECLEREVHFIHELNRKPRL